MGMNERILPLLLIAILEELCCVTVRRWGINSINLAARRSQFFDRQTPEPGSRVHWKKVS
jgi:hypothetical protein